VDRLVRVERDRHVLEPGAIDREPYDERRVVDLGDALPGDGDPVVQEWGSHARVDEQEHLSGPAHEPEPDTGVPAIGGPNLVVLQTLGRGPGGRQLVCPRCRPHEHIVPLPGGEGIGDDADGRYR
jgi:hypothetical protein